MAHEFESGLFVGEPAWHGLGVVLRDPPSIEDAIRLAGLDWTVRLAPLGLKEDGRDVDHRATVRETDNSILGVVGPGFVPLQNAAAFKWFQPLIDSGGVKLEAAGSLRDGRRIWILARIADASADVVRGDEIRQYVLLAHAHDGSLAIRVGFTAIRVVCANTLRASLESDGSALVRIQHRESAANALDKVRDALDLARREFVATTEQLRELARVGCDESTLKRYVREVFEPGSGDDEWAAKRTIAQVLPLFESGRGASLPGVRGTLWGAYNAITEFTTHVRGRSADARVESAWFGDSAKLAKRAIDVGLELARAA
jgi:phage/plasmid-like protein (TIGR03299 family)